MVFDDSFEHEVVHDGDEPRFVLYAVLHHPELGTPVLRSPSDAVCADDMKKIPATSIGSSSECARERHSVGSAEEPLAGLPSGSET